MLCLGLAVVFGYIIPIIDVKLSNTFLGAAHLPPGAIAVLLILLLVVNPLLYYASQSGQNRVIMLAATGIAGCFSYLAFKTWGGGSGLAWLSATGAIICFLTFLMGNRPFSRNETLTVYSTCLFSCLTPGHGSENFFMPNLIGPYYYATPENKWLDFLNNHVPPWMTPALSGGAYDQQTATAGYNAVQGWYTGGGAVPWGIWLVPLFAWSAMVLASYVMLGCLSVILRAQWAEREALAFPLLRLPLELTEQSDQKMGMGALLAPFFRNRLMWIGFGIAVFIQGMNGLHLYFPDVPEVPLSLTGNYFSETPWNQIGSIKFQVLPIVVGITYLLTSEVSFSLWFFYWFIKFELILAYFLGQSPASLPNFVSSTAGAKIFTGYQQIGCYLGFVLLLLWTGREHLLHVTKRAFGRAPSTAMERHEMMSYPVAFWGFILSFVFIIGWSVLAGMSLPLAIFMWLTYLVISIALTRVIVEGGLLFVQQGWGPLGVVAQLTQSGPGTWLTSSNVLPAAFVQGAMMTDLRAFLMPSFLQTFKLAYDRKIRAGALLALIAAVTVITYGISLYMNVKLGYENGGLSLNGWFAKSGSHLAADATQSLAKGVPAADWKNSIWILLGLAMTVGMMAARSRLLWFPLHPLGLLMCLTYPMIMLWFSILIGWMFKVLITRFGGSDTYRKTAPAFLGLALGDVVMMLVWLCVDGVFGKINHQLMPG